MPWPLVRLYVADMRNISYMAHMRMIHLSFFSHRRKETGNSYFFLGEIVLFLFHFSETISQNSTIMMLKLNRKLFFISLILFLSTRPCYAFLKFPEQAPPTPQSRDPIQLNESQCGDVTLVMYTLECVRCEHCVYYLH